MKSLLGTLRVSKLAKNVLILTTACPTKTCFVITTAYKRVLPTKLQLGLITTKEERPPDDCGTSFHYAYLVL